MRTKKELLKSKQREDVNKLYDRVLLVPSGLKHDSGYMKVAVIGVNGFGDTEECEICAYPDDISCFFPVNEKLNFAKVRMDCYYPSGVFQYHTHSGKFKVSEPLSSVDIIFVPSPKER